MGETGREARAEARLRRQRVKVFSALGVAAAVLVLVLVLLFTVGPWGSPMERPGEPPLGYLVEPGGNRQYRVTAWTFGDRASFKQAVRASAIDEVDFDWYQSRADGRVVATAEDLELVALVRSHELNVFATVTNAPEPGAAFSGELAAAILATPEARRRHIDALVDLAVTKGYDGVDLDWEDVHAEDRERFSLFVEGLGDALHDAGRLLSIAVPAKTAEPGRWPAQQAMDYARLGAAVDEFKIMTYAYSGPWSEPGPQAPLDWLDEVLSFADEAVPPEKTYMGVPFFGFSWRAGTARAMTAKEVAGLPERFFANADRDPASDELVLRFVDDYGVAHLAYVQDRRALESKLGLLRAKHPDVAGIALWVMGQEAPGFWEQVRRSLR